MVNLNSQKGIDLNTQNWLDLNEFATKYKVSLSTLRRRIRLGEIENFFKDGKYWVPDEPISKNARQRERVMSHHPKTPQKAEGAKFVKPETEMSVKLETEPPIKTVEPTSHIQLQKFMAAADLAPDPAAVNTPTPTAVNATPHMRSAKINDEVQPALELRKLVSELKSAYVTVLHEKESQITQLKEEIADLKTLVKILESDNERLKDISIMTEPPQDNGIPLMKNWQLGDLDL